MKVTNNASRAQAPLDARPQKISRRTAKYRDAVRLGKEAAETAVAFVRDMRSPAPRRHALEQQADAILRLDDPWADYLTTLPEDERARRTAIARRIVGDAKFITRLYRRFCASKWHPHMTFEHWLKRRQRMRRFSQRPSKKRRAQS